MLSFNYSGSKYNGGSALEIVRALELDAEDYPHAGRSVREFLSWSLDRLADRLPLRDLDLSDRLEDEALALSYLYLRDEYGVGRLSVEKENNHVDGTRSVFEVNGAPGAVENGLSSENT